MNYLYSVKYTNVRDLITKLSEWPRIEKNFKMKMHIYKRKIIFNTLKTQQQQKLKRKFKA